MNATQGSFVQGARRSEIQYPRSTVIYVMPGTTAPKDQNVATSLLVQSASSQTRPDWSLMRAAILALQAFTARSLVLPVLTGSVPRGVTVLVAQSQAGQMIRISTMHPLPAACAPLATIVQREVSSRFRALRGAILTSWVYHNVTRVLLAHTVSIEVQ